MNKIYFMCDNPYQKIASAVAPIDTPLGFSMIDDLENVEKLPFDFTLKNMVFKKKGFVYNDDFSKYKELWGDCQLNDKGWLLFSERLRTLIEKYLKGEEGIRWISCNIIHKDEKKNYFIPCFTKQLDVLDMDKCFFDNREPTLENLIKPVFDFAKANQYTIFSLPRGSNRWKIPSAVYISEELKKAITKAGIKGISFEQVAVSY